MNTGGGTTSIGSGSTILCKDIDFSDSHATARAWKAVLAYLMMDDRYLYLN